MARWSAAAGRHAETNPLPAPSTECWRDLRRCCPRRCRLVYRPTRRTWGALEHDRIVVADSSSRSCARLSFFGLAGPIGRVGTMRQRLWLKPGARGFRLTTPFLALGAAEVGFEPTIEVALDAGFQDRCRPRPSAEGDGRRFCSGLCEPFAGSSVNRTRLREPANPLPERLWNCPISLSAARPLLHPSPSCPGLHAPHRSGSRRQRPSLQDARDDIGVNKDQSPTRAVHPAPIGGAMALGRAQATAPRANALPRFASAIPSRTARTGPPAARRPCDRTSDLRPVLILLEAPVHHLRLRLEHRDRVVPAPGGQEHLRSAVCRRGTRPGHSL
jgi:hypothetical protein